MTTRDYADAYDDDSENVREKDAEIERLQNELHGVLCDRAEAWATINRLTLGVGPKVIKVKPQPKVVWVP